MTTFYRLRQVEQPDDWQQRSGRVEEDGHVYFRGVGISRGIRVFYHSEESVRRALVQINGSYRSYEIVAFEVNENV